MKQLNPMTVVFVMAKTMISFVLLSWIKDLDVSTGQFCKVSGYCYREWYRWKKGQIIPNKQSTINIVHTFARIGQWSTQNREIAVAMMLELREMDLRYRSRYTTASVVNKVIATDAAFCSDTRVTLAGSSTPSLNMSPN